MGQRTENNNSRAMTCSPREGCLVTWSKILGGFFSVFYGVITIMALGFDIHLAMYQNFYLQMVALRVTNCLFGLLLFLTSGCRVESVVSQFGFLAYDGTWNWNGVPLGLIVGIFHWVSCLSALIHRGCFGSRTWQSIPPDERPTVKVVEQQQAPAG